MKVHLLSPDRDVDLGAPDPPFADDVTQDLQLDYLWDAMAGGDRFLREVARKALLLPETLPSAIVYRQRALADTIAHPSITRDLYDTAVDALQVHKGIFMMPVRAHPELELAHAVRILAELAERLERLRGLAPVIAADFVSPAFRDLAATIEHELNEGYMADLRSLLHELSFPAGLLMSAGIAPGGQVAGQVLRRGRPENRGLFDRTPLRRPRYSFVLPDRDEAGAQAMSDLKNRSLNEAANAASQAVDHVLDFFAALRTELGFYLACGNVTHALERIGTPLCVPDPTTTSTVATTGLYDPCLALRTGTPPVGNDIEQDHERLLVVTGANRGGKSTLLRACGTAQLMMQAGMPAPATAFAATPTGAVLTHWAREEDTGLNHGKLDEELDRMERIVHLIRPGDLLLCNESFASTNEAEGSQILLDITEALHDAGVRVGVVTHLYDFAHAVGERARSHVLFLRAPRAGGSATAFRLEPGPPLTTSYGLDLYDRVFGTHLGADVTTESEASPVVPSPNAGRYGRMKDDA